MQETFNVQYGSTFVTIILNLALNKLLCNKTEINELGQSLSLINNKGHYNVFKIFQSLPPQV